MPFIWRAPAPWCRRCGGIDDRATLELMEPFVASICQPNADKAAALREAQQQSMRYLRMYRDHTHPFYWASFTISGS
jgi:CHAT domain-containing protein